MKYTRILWCNKWCSEFQINILDLVQKVKFSSEKKSEMWSQLNKSFFLKREQGNIREIKVQRGKGNKIQNKKGKIKVQRKKENKSP